jgi:phosphatidylglycerophosphatase A
MKMDRVIIALATGFYTGRLPLCPGTWGSLVAIIPWFFLRNLTLPAYLLMLVLVFVVGFFVSGSAEKLLDQADAGPIVIDEILGMFITLICAPDHPAAWVLGFLLFRVFDIIKPFPCSWFDERIHGGIGIMMDDVIAGIYSLASLQLIWFGVTAIWG